MLNVNNSLRELQKRFKETQALVIVFAFPMGNKFSEK